MLFDEELDPHQWLPFQGDGVELEAQRVSVGVARDDDGVNSGAIVLAIVQQFLEWDDSHWVYSELDIGMHLLSK